MGNSLEPITDSEQVMFNYGHLLIGFVNEEGRLGKGYSSSFF
jgi:hypothetical protein